MTREEVETASKNAGLFRPSMLFLQAKAYFPGLLFSLIIGMAASFVSAAYGGPTVLFALLLGMAFNFISADSGLSLGVAFASRSVLRLGVAALGARITIEQILGLGWRALVGVSVAVFLTIVFGFAVANALGLKRRFGVLTAGAVAICGASAAAAIAAVLPRHEMHERDTVFTIIAVTTLGVQSRHLMEWVEFESVLF